MGRVAGRHERVQSLDQRTLDMKVQKREHKRAAASGRHDRQGQGRSRVPDAGEQPAARPHRAVARASGTTRDGARRNLVFDQYTTDPLELANEIELALEQYGLRKVEKLFPHMTFREGELQMIVRALRRK